MPSRRSRRAASTKLGGTLIPAAPGTEAEVLRALGDGVTGDGAAAKAAQALEEPGAIVLVGERLATVPGALSAAAALDLVGQRPPRVGAPSGR